MYLTQHIIDHSFDSNAVLCFGTLNKQDFKFEELKSSCSSHSHGQIGEFDLDAIEDLGDHNPQDRISFKDMIILDHRGKFIQNWERFDTLCCLYSGYLYAWVACFGIAHTDSSSLFLNTVFVEAVFTISIITRFLTDYNPDDDGSHERVSTVRVFKKIAIRYLISEFPFDIFLCIPFNFIYGTEPDQLFRLLCIIKILRLRKGLKVFNVATFR